MTPPQHAARIQVSCGPSFCLAVTAANVWSWGAGEGCVLGHGDTLTRETPVQIEAFQGSVVLQVMNSAQYRSIQTTHDAPPLGRGTAVSIDKEQRPSLGSSGILGSPLMAA